MLESNFFDYVGEIDLIVSNEPTDSSVEKALELCKTKQLNQYFFSKLKRSDWLQPLKARGVFSTLPESSPGDLNVPYWNQMEYLLSVAKDKTSEVFEIIEPHLKTSNQFVQAGILVISKELDDDKLLIVVSALKTWLSAPLSERIHTIRHAIIGLINELINREMCDPTESIFRTLLEVHSKERSFGEAGFTIRDVVSTLDSYGYRTILKNEFRKFYERYPEVSINLILDLLSIAVESRSKGKAPNDYSTIWCQDLSRPTLAMANEVEEILVAACRDYTLEYIKNHPGEFETVLENYSKRNWAIFQRLKIFLVSKNTTVSKKITDQELLQTDRLNDYATKKEYLNLLRECQSILDGNPHMELILAEIAKGPSDLHEDPNSLTADDIKYGPIREAYWFRERLSAIEPVLPSEWKQKLKSSIEIIKKNEEENPPHPEGVWTGPNSSKTVDELLRMSDAELIKTLQDEPVKPIADWLSSPRGLSRNLSQVIAKDPNREHLFSEISKLNPVYIDGFMSGIREASTKLTEKTWKHFIQMILEIKGKLPKDSSSDEEQGPFNEVGSWVSVKKSISWVLSGAVKSNVIVLYSELSDEVLSIIEWLAEDKHPTAEYEKVYLKSTLDAYQMAINSVRSEAIECSIQFALKQNNLLKKNKKPVSKLPSKIEKLLSYHIDPTKEQSLAVRSVYGVLLPWLILIDKNWVLENLVNLFPKPSESKNFAQVVWMEYLMFNQAYDDVFLTLKEQYEKSIEEIGESSEFDSESDNPKKKITEHLMTMYWRGKVQLNDGMLKLFYDRAPLKLRKYALNFVGRSIKNTKEEMPSDIRDGFQNLLETRFKMAKDAGQLEELSPFGWWFNSNHFSKEWRLTWLDTLLGAGVNIEPDFDVIETLDSFKTSTNPTIVLNCLSRLIDQDKTMRLYTDRETIRITLTYCLQSTMIKSVQAFAVEIANKMGSKGYMEFRDLLLGQETSH